jgi:hypothetical protein
MIKLNCIFPFLLAIVLLSGCNKNDTPFEVYFFTSDRQLAPLYIVHDNDYVSPVYLKKSETYITDTATNKLLTFDHSARIDAVDAKGQIITTIKLTLNEDGTYKASGGGYVDYEIKIIDKYKLVVDYKHQF